MRKKIAMRLEDYLADLSYREFEDFAEKAVKSIESFRDVRREVMVAGWQIDIVAKEKGLTTNGVEWLFEVKANLRSRIGSDVIRQLCALALHSVQSGGVRRVALITRTRLTRQAAAMAEVYGIEVWDPPRLVEILPERFLKDEIFDFSASYPEAESLDLSSESLARALESTPRGQKHWNAYQALCSDIVQFLFCPPLGEPMAEVSDQDKRNRRDIVMENGVSDGFWARIRVTYEAHYIVADAKNYKEPIKKEPVLSVAHYLKPHGCGMFGLILSRAGAGPAARHAIKEQWIGSRKLILVLSDDDVREMLQLKSEANDPELLLGQRIRDFRLSL